MSTSPAEASAYGYHQARETLQWLVSARVMWRQAEQQQPRPNAARLKDLNDDIEQLLREWSSLQPDDVATIDYIQQVYEPEVRRICMLLGADKSAQ